MNIVSVRIQNFRGIKRLDLKLGRVTILIGENNTGKTSVLDALRLALYHLGSRRAIFNEMDFHLPDENATPSSAKPISIEILFSDQYDEPWDKELQISLNRAKILQIDDVGTNRVHLRLTCEYDQATREFAHQWSFLDQGKIELSKARNDGIQILREELQYYYLSALRDASRHFDAKGPFWRPFLKDSQLSQDKKSEIEERLKEVNNLIVSSHASFNQVKDQLHQLQSLIPLGSEDPVSIEAVPSRTFEILSKAEIQIGAITGAKIPLALHGEGTQSLAVLMLFFAFLESREGGTSILALEEPEAHLHPSAIRMFWKLVQNFANQRLISTHSGELIAETNVGDIRRLARTSDGIKAFHIRNDLLSPEETNKFNYHIRRTRGELLFARCWLLVEGQTEIWVYEAAARACGLDLHKEGVRLVEFQHSGINIMVKTANSLGIAWYCVGDSDKQREKVEPTLRRGLDGAKEEDRYTFPYPNIEIHLLKNGFEDVYSRYMPKQNLEKITKNRDDPEYWGEYYEHYPNRSKTKAAADIALEWTRSNARKVTPEIRSVLDKAISLARGDQID
ncbi:MAG: DUF2813 domain-containing protein [Bacteroidetes bacterium]|nr:DUF2813 domain-containing protein [Bacteroidota bacterium]